MMPPLPIAPARDLRAGFTLLEILVVVLIITILATLVGVNVVNKPGEAKVAVARTQLGTLRSALQLYRMQQGGYPTQEQGLEALCRPPTAPPLPQAYPEGGYLGSRQLPADPWGQPYVYLIPGPDGEPFEVLSYGRDGEPGGDGDATDLLGSLL